MTLPACTAIAEYKDLSHEDWLNLRKTGLGGSDTAGCMGYPGYSSPLTIVLEKTGRIAPNDLSDNEFVEVGNLLEPIIRRELVKPYIKDKLGLDVEVIDPTAMYRSNDYPWMLVNPDGFLVWQKDKNHFADRVGLEIKTGSSYQLKHWGGKDGNEVPDNYYCQVQHYMAGTGLSEWWVFGLIGNQRVLRIVPRNDEFIARMIEDERRIWEIIQQNDPLLFPLPNGSDTDMDAIMQLSNPQDNLIVDMQDCNDKIDWYLMLNNEIKTRKDKSNILKQEIIMAMDTHKYGETSQYKISFSKWDSTNFDRKKFEKENPQIDLSPYITLKESGRLSVKEK